MKLQASVTLITAILLGLGAYASALAVMSIDMSSEFMKIGLVKPGVPMEIVLNKESRRKTPSVVAIKDGETFYGDSALNVAIKQPKKSFLYFQDLLVKDLQNPLVHTFLKRFPHYELGEEDNRVFFKTDDGTNYFPEELLAIAFNTSREMTQDFAEQLIKDVVITVPPYFNQAERLMVKYAAELAGLRVLQLMNDNAAVALNYGIFRRKEFDTTEQHYMFFDMGSGSTVASVVGYQMVQQKEKGMLESNPQLTIKGFGYDRTLGGSEFDIRLRDHLAKLFTQQGKTKSSVYESPRAMAKLLKEAKRLKKILSANTDHVAQVEGLLEDVDFKARVNRAEFEMMCDDLFDKIDGVIQLALKSADITMGEIESVILVGGGTRVPKVQETLLKVTGKSELGKNINTDEAAALGAVYQAAHLSKGFKVKKFLIRDISPFPIQVTFEKVTEEEVETKAIKIVKRTLFQRNNVMPQKKVMTFNKHTHDFTFNINYGDFEGFVTDQDSKSFGSRNLSHVSVKGVEGILLNHTDDVSQGIKAHFRLDENGILHLDSVEAVFERTENVTENETKEEEQSTLQKLGSTISRFFSGSNDDEDGTTKVEESAEEEEKSLPEEVADEEEEQKEQKDETTDEKTKETEEDEKTKETEEDEKTKETEEDEKTKETEEDEKTTEKEEDEQKEAGEKSDKDSSEEHKDEDEGKDEDASKEEDSGEDEKQKSEEDEAEKQDEDKESEKETSNDEKPNEDETKKKKEETESKSKEKKVVPKVLTIKENITIEVEMLDLILPSKQTKKASKEKLLELKKKQEAKRAKDQALNNLEAFVFDTQSKMYDEDVIQCSTEEERDLIKSELTDASDWIYDVDDDANATVFKNKLRSVKKLTKDLFFRVKEKQGRPELIGAIKEALNASKMFLVAMKNLSSIDLPDLEPLFSEVEIGMLEKAYNNTKEWFIEKLGKQKKLADTEKPVLLLSDMSDKLSSLDRELRYLAGKAKSKPKKKKKPKTEKPKNDTGETEASNTTKAEKDTLKKVDDEETVIPPLEEPQVEDTPQEEPQVEDTPQEKQTEEQAEEAQGEDKEEEIVLQLEGEPQEEEVLQLGEENTLKTENTLETPDPISSPDADEERENEDTKPTEEAVATKKPNSHNSGDL